MTEELAQKNGAIVREIYDAAGRMDMSVLERYLAPDVRLVEAVGHPVGRTLWEGADEFMSGLREVFGLLRLTGFVFHDVVAGPERVVGLLDVLSTDASGVEVTVPVAEVFRIVDGRIVEIRPYYFDLVAVRELVGR